MSEFIVFFPQISSYQEILVLLWKLLDENQAFTQALVNHEKLLPLTVSLVYMMWSGRLNPTKVCSNSLCTVTCISLHRVANAVYLPLFSHNEYSGDLV